LRWRSGPAPRWGSCSHSRAAPGFGFFTFILAYGVGILAGRATLRGAGYYRSATTGWIAAGGAAWAYVIAAAVIAIEVNGNARAYVQVFGLLIAAFFAHREAS